MSEPLPERAAFEAWCDEHWGNCAYLHKSATCGEWDAWQAARAHSEGRIYTQADLLEAVKTERHACSIAVWMTLQDALEPGADDKGLDGWMREAEQRVKNRLAHHGPPYALQAQQQPAPADGFCWLVELFEPDGNSMGHYHTGATTLLSFESRTTRDPLKAARYATKRDALLACAGLLHLQGVWRAVEHGFGDYMDEPVTERELAAVAAKHRQPSRAKRMADAGYTRRPSAKSLPSDE